MSDGGVCKLVEYIIPRTHSLPLKGTPSNLEGELLLYLSLREPSGSWQSPSYLNEITASGFALLVMTNPILNFIVAQPNRGRQAPTPKTCHRAGFGSTFCLPKGRTPKVSFIVRKLISLIKLIPQPYIPPP